MIPLSMLCLSIAWSPKLLKLQVHSELNSEEYRSLGAVKVKTARNRITLITSILKFIFIVLFACGFNFAVYLTENHNASVSLYRGLKHFADDNTMLTTFLVQVCCFRIIHFNISFPCHSHTSMRDGPMPKESFLTKTDKMFILCLLEEHFPEAIVCNFLHQSTRAGSLLPLPDQQRSS